MRITSKGQVTIPAYIREQAGLLPNTEVEFVWDGQAVRLVKLDSKRKQSRGQAIVERMRGQGAVAMTTDEIMTLMRGE